MKILVHDPVGYSFQVQLSGELAARGHRVLHVSAASASMARGDLVGRDGEMGMFRLQIVAGDNEAGARESSLGRRRLGERAYGRRVAAVVEAERPDVVVLLNGSMEVQEPIVKACRAHGAAYYYWVQDFHSLGLEKVWRRRFPVAGALAGAYYRWLEGAQLRGAAGVVVMADECAPVLRREFGVRRDRITTIPNGAPLESMPVRPKRNAWSEAHGLADKHVCLYAGPLSMGHGPSLLLDLARRYRHDDAVRVVVISEGPGADWLKERTAVDPLPGLVQLPFQEASVMPDILATGDLLIGVLEEEAGMYGVPPEILTYLCAERPILLAAPSGNAATRMVARERVGMTCAPGDAPAFLEAVDHMRSQAGLGSVMGRRARAYAEKAFRIGAVADQFERVFAASTRDPSIPDRTAAATGTQVLAA